jgi:hypothetical protein
MVIHVFLVSFIIITAKAKKDLKLWSLYITAIFKEFLMHINHFGILVLLDFFPWVSIGAVDRNIGVLHQHPGYENGVAEHLEKRSF